MIENDDEEVYETELQRVTDTIYTLVTTGPHPALTYSAMMSFISGDLTYLHFWDSEGPIQKETEGYWSVMWRLKQKAFADIESGKQAPISFWTR